MLIYLIGEVDKCYKPPHISISADNSNEVNSLYEMVIERRENAVPVIKIELLAERGEIKISLRYESDGIKKIISILSALIAMYNKPGICLAVDELDAGIFEYLLG